MFHVFFFIIFLPFRFFTSRHYIVFFLATFSYKKNFLFEAKKCRGKLLFFLFFISSFPPVNRFESEMKKWARKQKRSKWGQKSKEKKTWRKEEERLQNFINAHLQMNAEKSDGNESEKKKQHTRKESDEKSNLVSNWIYLVSSTTIWLMELIVLLFKLFWNIQPSSELKMGRVEVNGE